ncbi:MAG: group I truncated hemoglobin [Saprospiraceae bacterium]
MGNNASLFERIGGMNAVNAAVAIFYAKVLSDESISHFFNSTDMTAQSVKMKAFLAVAFGAPMHAFSGKNMRDAHAHMYIDTAHFDAVTDHLIATLEDLNIAQNLIDEVVAIALSTKDDVLTLHPAIEKTSNF